MHIQEVLSTSEAAERIGIDRSTLTRWVAKGRITPVIKGRSENNGAMFFSAKDVDELAAKYEWATS